jgi:hypothetical protein
VHLIGCFTVVQSSTYVLLLSIGYRTDAGAPIFNGNSSPHPQTKCATPGAEQCATPGARPVGRATPHARKCGRYWTKPSLRAMTALLQRRRPILAPHQIGFSAFRGSFDQVRTAISRCRDISTATGRR